VSRNVLTLIVVLLAALVVATASHGAGRQLILAPTGYTIADVPVVLTPDPNRAPFAIIPAKTRVRITGRTGDWYEISFRDQHWGNRVGYVKKKFVAVLDDSEPPPETPRDDVAVPKAVEPAPRGSTEPSLASSLERVSLSGWNEARKLAAAGGAVDLLAPIRSVLNELELLKNDDVSLEVEYAQTSIRAAVAAAQDERPEMELLLTHARDLSERMVDRGRRPQWPRPFNLLAGELWFEVDRYEEARRAFERAVKADASAAAWVGLARAHARLGNTAEACAAYREVPAASPLLLEEDRTFLASCS
jgi:tetratricopeptide (TPR) repeat protein